MAYILGISAFYHDSAACLVHEGRIVAAAQEERFSRIKHDAGFPTQAVGFCLKQAGIGLQRVDHIAFYEKPLLKFERLLETYLSFAPRGFASFITAMPVWLKEKLLQKKMLQRQLAAIGGCQEKDLPPILFTEHHEAHAASAFYPSPFEQAAILCLDGVGEWTTTSGWNGQGNELTPLWEIPFPHSLGLLYSAMTYYTGFKVNSGEYKVMGLAPYGEPRYVQDILDQLIDIKADGSFRLNMEYFNYCTGLTMTNARFDKLFGGPPRPPESELTQREMDLARSVQDVTEEVMLRLARTARQETGLANLCLAGGVALNCVGNGKILRAGIFDQVWIQPAAGDAGGALGAALAVWYGFLAKERVPVPGDAMAGSYLGPAFSAAEIRAFLQGQEAPHEYIETATDLYSRVAAELAAGKVVGWFQGRMEFGPRALGGRSILGDARSQEMQSVMNLKISNRESFRPFAPAVLRERVGEYFEMDTDSPYMLLVAPVVEARRLAPQEGQAQLWGIERLKQPRSDIPAVTHVDFSARVQTVNERTNPHYYGIIHAFEALTGCATIVNTSFNVRGEPIVCAPEDAYRCFMRTEMDILVLGEFVLEKAAQKPWEEDVDWRTEFALD